MQCIRAFVAQQPDELSLDKADIILVHQKTSDRKFITSPFSIILVPFAYALFDCRTALHLSLVEKKHSFTLYCIFFTDWVEGTRLPDCHRGWVPEPNLETISNPRVRQRNLSDALKLTTATAAV